MTTTELTPRQMIGRLVSVPTVSAVSNLDLIDWLDGCLSSHGVTSHRPRNEDRQTAAVSWNASWTRQDDLPDP